MSYTIFALKWRPKNFDEIVGQGHIVATLKSAIQKNRLASAYLFSGPRGVGKTSCARILAKALNCKDGPVIAPCQECSACLEIAQGRSLDVIEIDGASNRGIEEIRALRENVKFAPARGKFKIYIIDEVHMLTTEAFNALLKTLEEPPGFVKFIFATTQPHKVIPTILSRCQRLEFRRVPVMEMIGQLEHIARDENIKVDKEVFFAIAKASDGSLRDAESILDQLVSFSKERISLKDVISVLGLVEQDALFAMTDRIIQKDAKGALELFNRLVDEGKDTSVFLANFIEHFRNLMIARVTQADVKLIDLPQEICQMLLKQSRLFSMEEIFSVFNTLVNTQEMAKRLESTRIPLEISLVKLAYSKKSSPVSIRDAGQEYPPAERKPPKENAPTEPPKKNEEIIPRIPPEADRRETGLPFRTKTTPSAKDGIPQRGIPDEAGERDSLTGLVQDEGAQEPFIEPAQDEKISSLLMGNNLGAGSQTTSYNPVSLNAVKDAWGGIIESLQKVKMSVSTYLSEGEPAKIEGNSLTVFFPRNYSLHKEALEGKENKAIIETAIRELLKINLRLNFMLSKEDRHPQDNKNNPSVKSALDIFGGRVVKEG